MDHIHPSGAGHEDDPHVAGILQSHGTCQVRSAVSSVLAAESDDFRFECFGHKVLFIQSVYIYYVFLPKQ
jgi:hypothetical protein